MSDVGSAGVVPDRPERADVSLDLSTAFRSPVSFHVCGSCPGSSNAVCSSARSLYYSASSRCSDMSELQMVTIASVLVLVHHTKFL
jgi:hypothetical protein